jgi:hypothetical protein
MTTKVRKTRKSRKTCKHGKLKKSVRTKSGRKRKCKKKRRKSSKKSKRKRKHKIVTFRSYSGGSNLGISTDGTLRYGYSDPNTNMEANCIIL